MNRHSSISAKPAVPLKRSRMNKVGKVTQQWFDTRAEWIANNPPPIEGRYWQCYLGIHPWCPGRVDIDAMQLDHVVSRTRDPSRRFDQSNLRPSCEHCNAMKGSRSLDEVKPGAI